MASADTPVAGARAGSTEGGGARLQGGQLTVANCIALSAAVMAPVIAVILNAPAAAGSGGAGLPLAFLAAFIATAFVANTVIEFSKRLPSSGSFYTFCSHGLGSAAGFFTGWLYFAAFVLLAVGLFTANGAFLHDYLDSEWSANIPWWILSLILMGLVLLLSIRSIVASVRVDLALLAFEMIVFLTLGIIAVTKAGDGNSLEYFTPSASPDGVSGIGLAAVFGILSFIGFESAAVLGEETRNARKSIPRAVLGATVIIGVFYIFMMYSLSAGYRLNDPAQMKAFLGDTTPFPTLAERYASGMTQIIEIAAIFGLFSCFLAVQNATVRVIFAMGRDGVLPPALGRVHRSWHSPYVAIYALTVFSIVVGIALSAWLGSGLTDVYGWTGSIGTVAIVLVYIMANVALIRFFANDPDRSVLRHVILPILGILALLYPLYSVAKPGQPHPFNLVPIIVVAWVLIGVVVYFVLRSRAPGKLAALGKAIADDDEHSELPLATAPAGPR